MNFDYDAMDERDFERRLQEFDEAHARARSPARRRKIEAQVKQMQAEMEDMRQKAKVVDIAYARWVKRIEELLKRG